MLEVGQYWKEGRRMSRWRLDKGTLEKRILETRIDLITPHHVTVAQLIFLLSQLCLHSLTHLVSNTHKFLDITTDLNHVSQSLHHALSTSRSSTMVRSRAVRNSSRHEPQIYLSRRSNMDPSPHRSILAFWSSLRSITEAAKNGLNAPYSKIWLRTME